MNRVLIATMLVAVLPAGAVVVPADAPQETVVDRLLAGFDGQVPAEATVNGVPVPVEDALALLRAIDVPMPPELEGLVQPDADLGVGIRRPGPDVCTVAGFVVANSLSFDGTPPPPALVNVQADRLLTQEPASMGFTVCRSGIYDTWLGTVSAEVAPTAIVRVACLSGPAPFTNGFWMSEHHKVTNCHANDFGSVSLEGRVGHVDIVARSGSVGTRIAVLFGGTMDGPVGGIDEGPGAGADVVVANLA